ncbi:rod shape-determining protein MreD [Thiohalorhabdus methylotrophus]|uniref:Rod shape-determining protein MreD n=1 Tax=Thiohalorhabdus methylotrophus TaxID=3242694 RepID=A0ABV4TZT6_9GAMM
MNLGGHLVVATSIAVALGLGGLPLAQPITYLWPDWVLLTISYWGLAAPHRYGLGMAFIAGLFQDVSTATLLGLHALIYVFSLYLIIENHLRIRLLHLWGQTLVVFFLALFSVLLQLWVEGTTRDLGANLWSLVSAVTTGLFWSPVFLFLRSLRQRFSIA